MKRSNPRQTFAVLLTITFLAAAQAVAQPLVRVDSFFMPSLGRTKKLSVLVPAHYDPMKRYPVLYLLHGYTGGPEDWLKHSRLQEYARELPLLIVMPDAENSWYINSFTEQNDQFETYLVKDIPQYIQTMYSVDTTRQAIAGLSMGGYGALMLGLRHPTHYAFLGSLSGAIAFPRGMNDTTRPAERALLPSLKKAFGEKTTGIRNAHDVFLLYRQTSKDSLPYIYMAIGTQDGYRTFLPANRAFTDLLRTYGAAYEYHETPGGHTWQYWDREIQPLLLRMREVLKF
ncbi:MAG TPA: alpha/beta hydrolase family protein [Bacteroidota bacterium]|nr:alpha/beta hydrolase family protein [Bacteroidota bacterium]